ncbi:MAG: heavy metal sensor histidine kinase [Campylobacteraceae bacterium]
MNSLKKLLKSLLFKLILLISLSIIVIFLLSQFYIENSIKNHFVEFDKYELRLTSNLIKKALQNSENSEHNIDDILQARPNIFLYILNSKNAQVYFTNMKDYNLLPFIEDSAKKSNFVFDELQLWQNEDDFYRVFASSFEEFKIFVGMNINYHEFYIKELKIKLWTIATLSCFVAILICFLVVRYTLLPIKTTSKKIEQITSKKLNTRLDENDTITELQSLANSFNFMISNIEDMFKRQAKFSDDIAHELRTPISNLTTQTQIILSKNRDKEAYKEALYSNLEEFRRMSNMVNDMLLLSMCENRNDLETTSVNLSNEIAVLVEYYEDIAKEQQVSFEMDFDESLHVKANRELLQRALSNLLLNAIFYAKKDSTILLSVKKSEKEAIFEISNRVYEPLSSEKLNKIFDRFYKLDSSRQKNLSGSGIGLSIAKSIIKLHGGDIFAFIKEDMITFRVVFYK